MRFQIEDGIWDMFPDLIIGVVTAQGIDNSGEALELRSLIQTAQQHIRAGYESGNLSQIPRIQAWRQAYSTFGAKPKKYKSSIESLCRMSLKGLPLRSVNTVVDIYNLISLKHLVPAGGDDMDKVEGDITLAFASGEERFVPLNGFEEEFVKPGEVIYRDERGVLCRRWNWRECDRTKMTEFTRNVCLMVEGLPPVDHGTIQEVLVELGGLITRYCGGKISTDILKSGRRKIDLRIT